MRYVVARSYFFFLFLFCKAVKFIEQGHVRVGPDTITDPAFLITRLFSSFLLVAFLTEATDTWKTL